MVVAQPTSLIKDSAVPLNVAAPSAVAPMRCVPLCKGAALTAKRALLPAQRSPQKAALYVRQADGQAGREHNDKSISGGNCKENGRKQGGARPIVKVAPLPQLFSSTPQANNIVVETTTCI